MRWPWQNWLRQRRGQRELLSRKKTLIRELQKFEVGATTISVTFNDGREVYTKVYGRAEQYVQYEEQKAYPTWACRSEDVYRDMLQAFKADSLCKVYDDALRPTIAWTGIIQHMEIVRTDKYEVEIDVVRFEEPDDSL